MKMRVTAPKRRRWRAWRAGGAGGEKLPRNGEHPLAHGHVGKDTVDEVRCTVTHSTGVARWAGAPPLARKGDDHVVPTAATHGAREAEGWDAALDVGPKLFLDVRRKWLVVGLACLGKEGFQVLANDAVEHCLLGTVALAMW